MGSSGSVQGERYSKYRSLLLCLICSIPPVVSAGCGGGGDKYDRLPFSGTVTLNGQPLASGYVIFVPKSGQPTQSSGVISGGKFDVPRKSGVVAGKYSVAIFSGADAPAGAGAAGTPEAEAASKKNAGERVPRKYNVDSILMVEIEPGTENAFPFDLTTK